MFKKFNFSMEKKIFSSFKSESFIDFLLPNNDTYNEIFYTPTKTIIFEEGKYLILKTNPEIFNFNYKFKFTYLYILTNYFAFLNIYYLFALETLINFSSCFFLCSLYYRIIAKEECKLIIDKIYLLQDGKTLQIITYSNDILTYDIKDVRKLKHKELVLFYSFASEKSIKMFPLMIARKIFLLNPHFYDVELFPVICNSSYIKTPNDKYRVINI